LRAESTAGFEHRLDRGVCLEPPRELTERPPEVARVWDVASHGARPAFAEEAQNVLGRWPPRVRKKGMAVAIHHRKIGQIQRARWHHAKRPHDSAPLPTP